MTRETKVGMAVACSFLSLVAAVVVLRMRHGGEPDPATTGSGQVAQGQNGTTPGQDGIGSSVRPKAGKAASGKEPGVLVPAVYNSPGDALPVADPPGPPAAPAASTAAVNDSLPGLPPAPGPGLPDVPPPPIPQARPIDTPPPVAAPPNIPAPSAPPGGTTGAVAGLPTPPGSAELNKLPGFPGTEANPPPATPKEPTTPPAVAAAPADSSLPGLPAPPLGSAAMPAPPGTGSPTNKLSAEDHHKQVKEQLMNQVAAAGQTDGLPPPASGSATKLPVSAPGSGSEKGALPEGNDLLPPARAGLPPPPAPAPLPGSTNTPNVDPPPGNPLVPPAPAAAVAKEQLPGAPAVVKTPDVTLNKQLSPTDPPAAGTGRLPGVARPGEVPAAVALGTSMADDAPPGSRSPQIPGAPTPGLPAPFPPARAAEGTPPPLPPLGAPPAGSSAPIAVPVPPPQAAGSGPAKLQSFDVETHRVQPGDNTFADLSKKIYGSDKYAQALLQFNREYPLAGDNLKADPPRLEPGQPIYVPPTHILEQPRYASAPPPARPIASTPIAASVGVPPAAAVVPPRQAVAPPVPTVGNPGPVSAAPSAAGTRLYTVQGNGEMLFEIARQTLGDGRRWSEIYRLNPDIRPELAIPGGTQLRLPADARVGS